MVDLDAPDTYASVDRAGALSRILDLPNQLLPAWSLAQTADVPGRFRDASSILVCGMGGSAIGGDLVRSLVEGRIQVPMSVVRGYELPGLLDRNTLVILSSYSGNTEETLAACDQATRAGACLVAVTTGGVLEQRALERQFPLVKFSYPGQPREALGYSMMVVLGLLARLGFVSQPESEVRAARDTLGSLAAELGPQVPLESNPAKQLARRLYGKLAVFYGGGLMAEVVRRWKGQWNENAKAWAFFEQLPELDHNAVMGYRFPEAMQRGLAVVVVSCPANHARIALREEITLDLLAQAGIQTERVEARGGSALEQVLSAVHFGDLASYYLALLNGADPTEIDAINYLKGRLESTPTPSDGGRASP